MPQHDSPRSHLAYGWLRGEDFWGDPISANMLTMDMLMHPYALSMTRTNPPTGYALGDTFIIPPGGTDAWAGHDNQLTMMTETGWIFLTPSKGVEVRVENPAGKFWWTGEAWLEAGVDPDVPAAPGTRYDVMLSVTFAADADETLLVAVLPEPMELRAGAAGSAARCAGSPPAVDVVLRIRREGVQIGTITFSAGNISGVVAVPTTKAFAAKDILTIVCPPTMPSGFANYGAVLRLTLTNVGG